MVSTLGDLASNQPSEQRVQRGDHPEAPPSYFPQPEPGSIAGGSASLPPTFKAKPTNFLLFSTKYSIIRGEFFIDPSLRIPPSMLPPLGEGKSEDDRTNLSLTSDRSVHAGIWLLGSPSPSSPESTMEVHKVLPRRTTIALTSNYGLIRAQLHTLDGTAPFSLTARATWGTDLTLPRSFHGPLLVTTTYGRVSLSDELVRNATQLSRLETTQRYFVGDFRALSEGAWEGDQIEIETSYGFIQIKYVDEPADRGYLSWLLGK